MTRLKFIEHEGKELLLIDFSEMVDADEVLKTVAEAKALVEERPEHSLLTLTHVAGMGTDATTVKALWDLLRHNKPFVKAGAVVGVEGEQQNDLYQLLTHQARRKLETFGTLAEAKDWLARQD